MHVLPGFLYPGKGKKLKPLIKLLLSVLFIYAAVSTCASYIKNIPRKYTEDYPILYKEQLAIMFGSDYEIGEKKTVKIEAENCDCGYHVDGLIYDEWDITYQDQNGFTYTQTLNNRQNLESQQIEWLKNQLSSYYKQKYLLDRFPKGTFESLSAEEYFSASYCFIFIGSPVGSYTMDKEEEYNRTKEKNNQYFNKLWQSLSEEQNMIHFYNLDYHGIFQRFPIEVSMHLSIDEVDLSETGKKTHEEEIRENILAIMEDINRDTDYTCNLTVSITSNKGQNDLCDGSKSWRYYILRGEWFGPKDGEYQENYDWELFYALEGIFW